MYHVRGRSGTTAVTADHCIFTVWNDHSTARIKLVQVVLQITAGGATDEGPRFRRTTVRGTPGSTVTPDLDHHSERGVAPPTNSFLLDLAAYSVQPTLDTSDLYGTSMNVSTAGSAAMVVRFPGGGLVVPPGTGISAIKRLGVTAWPASEIFVTFKAD